MSQYLKPRKNHKIKLYHQTADSSEPQRTPHREPGPDRQQPSRSDVGPCDGDVNPCGVGECVARGNNRHRCRCPQGYKEDFDSEVITCTGELMYIFFKVYYTLFDHMILIFLNNGFSFTK